MLESQVTKLNVLGAVITLGLSFPAPAVGPELFEQSEKR